MRALKSPTSMSPLELCLSRRKLSTLQHGVIGSKKYYFIVIENGRR